jgi:hypothetical protein
MSRENVLQRLRGSMAVATTMRHGRTVLLLSQGEAEHLAADIEAAEHLERKILAAEEKHHEVLRRILYRAREALKVHNASGNLALIEQICGAELAGKKESDHA